jgi:predicted lysophospholipase L1 biosynthesis ABC-type transport system permease subunit
MLALIEIFIELFIELIFPFVVEIIFEVIICGFFSLLGELISTIFEKTGDAIEATTEALGDATEAAASSVKIGFLILFILVVTGILAGVVISWVHPDRIFEKNPLAGTGISLLITPLVMGLVMSLVGKWKVNHDRKPSFMATFLGGALFGLAAAGTRLIFITQF